MRKYLSVLVAMLLSYAMANEYKPHPEPIVSVTPPKPNIMMILDTSGSMSNAESWDMSAPDGYDPLSSNPMHQIRELDGHVTRAAALQWAVKNLLKKYRYQANIGITPLDGRQYKYSDRNDEFHSMYHHLGSIESDSDFQAINHTLLWFSFRTDTPLISPVYRASKLIRGAGDDGALQSYNSPIEYRCQEQHIILLTDGEQNEHSIGTSILSQDRFANNMNDLGLFLSELDIIKASKNKLPNDSLDKAGKSWTENEPGYRKMPIYAHAIRFGKTAASYDAQLKAFVSHSGRGIFAPADNTKELEIGFHKIFQNIIESRSGTGSYEDQLGDSRAIGSIRYSSYYDPINWLGEIRAMGYNETTKQFSDPIWTTNDTIKPNQGDFVSFKNGRSVSLDQLTILNDQQIKWLKGEHISDLRIRNIPLGDIIDSHITYSAKDQLNINLNTLGKDLRKRFLDYLVQKNRDKSHYNYVIAGSNDGLINFIYGEKASSGKGGQRHTSYFPSFFAEDIGEIAEPYYIHNFKVNGTTSLFDTLVDGKFRTIGITAMGAGKEALVGYQIYHESGKNKIEPTFEIRRGTEFSSLGYTYSDIEFFNMQIGNESKAMAVFGNGYTLHRDAAQKSVVYIIDAVTGEKQEEIELTNGFGGASSVATVISTDQEGYQQLNRLYVGDQSGKLFRVIFDTTQANPLEHYTVTTLFDAGSDSPITVKPMLVRDNSNVIWVYFGTGRAILKSDVDPQTFITHNVYGIKDSGVQVRKNQLTLQEIFEVSAQGLDDPLIDITQNRVGAYGWYIPLKLRNETEPSGERVILPASIHRNQSVVFTTYGVHIDESMRNDPCLGGGIYGKVFFVDLFSGKGSRNVHEGKGSGIISTDSSLGVPTGPGMLVGNPLSGNYSEGNDYALVKKQLITDNSESIHGAILIDDKESCNPSITGSDGKNKDIPVTCFQNRRELEPRRLYLKNNY